MTKTAVDPTLPPQDVEEEGPYNSSELLDVLGIILGGEATDEMREEALEALFIKWQIEPEIADVLREMLEDTDFESGFDMFSLYYAIAAECCPDYTHTYNEYKINIMSCNFISSLRNNHAHAVQVNLGNGYMLDTQVWTNR